MSASTVLWIVLGAVGVWMFFRMAKGGGCCGGHDEAEDRSEGHAQPGAQARRIASPAESNPSEVYAVDPVCGMEVTRASVHAIEHEGRSYSFCSAHCKEAFAADPRRYAVVDTAADTVGSE